MEYNTVKDHSYKETSLDKNRLKKELLSSINPNNIVDTKSHYWFLGIKEGEQEDVLSRS